MHQGRLRSFSYRIGLWHSHSSTEQTQPHMRMCRTWSGAHSDCRCSEGNITQLTKPWVASKNTTLFISSTLDLRRVWFYFEPGGKETKLTGTLLPAQARHSKEIKIEDVRMLKSPGIVVHICGFWVLVFNKTLISELEKKNSVLSEVLVHILFLCGKDWRKKDQCVRKQFLHSNVSFSLCFLV